jgi:CCR4-NOT transcription complex subunit 4
MWCWHRIRESETGLCPACRTPYGEDPHQFTALDVEEVLKANKEAQAAAKRERYQLQHHSSGGASASDAASGGDPDQFSTTTMEIPKDRTQLANMRVIRRNLIYAVGLPPPIANEETLRKPEYFGQYGKIAKIVLNRSQAVPVEGGDPRRASASAYVTFQYKEDTLACILALDGFYLENRNIRASYGTSKYCSAFIKNVRCNNPECTYLHEMGAIEDTFTKQEIQAGYVTSGRDVLARQQQIVAEQLQQQMQSASGGNHLPPRKRIGGGGPSGTGKASAHPVFPAPEFDEFLKAPPAVPAPSGISRAVTTQATMTPSAAQQAALLNPATISAKMGRSISVGATAALAVSSPAVGASNQLRKSQSIGTSAAAAATTAASVVAGGRSLSKDSADGQHPHSTLTALTPLKRSSGKAGTTAKVPAVEEKLPTIRNGKKQNGARAAAATVATAKAPSSAPAPKAPSNDDPPKLLSSIGGDVIGPPLSGIGNATSIGAGRLSDGSPTSDGSLAELGGVPIPIPAGVASSTLTRSSAATLLGGDIFTGSLPGHSVVGSSLLGGSSLLPGVGLSTPAPVGDGSLRRGGNTGFWSGGAAPGPSGNGVIGSHISSNVGGSNSSSALASILGINLPTGSGSLQETTSLWSATPYLQPPQGPSPLSMLNGSAIQQSHHHPGGGMGMMRMGGPSQPAHNGSSHIGGVPIGGGSRFSGPGTIGAGAGGSNQSDIALLQSLLPGVHITSDNNAIGFVGGNTGWAAAPGHPQSLGGTAAVGGNPIHQTGNWVGGGSSRLQPSTGSAVGAIGQNNGQQNQRQGPGIW